MLNIYLKMCSHICRACIIIRCFLVEYPPLGINIISECSVVCEIKICIVQSHNIRESQYQLAVFAYSLVNKLFQWEISLFTLFVHCTCVIVGELTSAGFVNEQNDQNIHNNYAPIL